MEIPVYFINGFLDSGKTSFIKETIFSPDFSKKYKTLIIQCEEGEEEFDKNELKKLNIEYVLVEDEERVNEEFLLKCRNDYKPDRVMIEYNGMWKTEDFLQLMLPKGWVAAQIITIINSLTYGTYLANMRPILLEQAKYSDLIIFNRINGTMDKLEMRKSIKTVNRRAQIIYEAQDGTIEDIGEDELPFNIDDDIIEIDDDSYGIWFMDAMDNPKKYHGKTVRCTAMAYCSDKGIKNSFAAGRIAMTCCADDVAFVGMLCKVDIENMGPLSLADIKDKQYIELTAIIRCEYYKEYKGKGPVLYAQSMKPASEPEEPMIYFN